MRDYTEDQQPPSSRALPASSQSASERTQNRRAILALISTLLSHFWTAAEPAAVREAQLADWLADLEGYTPKAVGDACAEYRRAHTKRPTIADIRQICESWAPPPRREGPSYEDQRATREFVATLDRRAAEALESRRAYLAGEIDGRQHDNFKDVKTRFEGNAHR